MSNSPQPDNMWDGFPMTEPISGGPHLWDDPIPLVTPRDLPLFPTDALPEWVADMVASVAEETQTPADLAGCMALAVLSTAAGGRAVVAVRGSWREPVNIYSVTALPPGNRKSAVVALMSGPLLAAERELVVRTQAKIAEAETLSKLARASAEKAQIRAAKAPESDRDRLTAEAVELAQLAEEQVVPARPQLVADDITPENAATLLAQQGGRIALLSAEGGIFDIIAGRYSGNPNLDVFLKGHAGDMLRINRQGRDPQFVQAPAVTMGLAVQPDVLADIARVKGFEGRGLLARYLYSLPKSLVGYRNLEPRPISEETAALYAKRLGGLTLALADWTDPAVLTLSPEADAVLLEHQKATEPKLRKGGELARIITWASKLDGAVVRIAGLLHLAANPEDGGYTRPIDAATIANAARIGAYFTAHALAVFDLMGTDSSTAGARAVLDWLAKSDQAVVKQTTLYERLRRIEFDKVEELEAALDLLEDCGWVRKLPPPPAPPAGQRKGGRPPKPSYELHPKLKQHAAAKPE